MSTKLIFIISCLLCFSKAEAQSLGAGTLRGTVTDATTAPIPLADVELSNPLTGYSRQARTGPDGGFVISNIPPNKYTLEVSFAGFQTSRTQVTVQTAVPLALAIQLDLAGQQESVTVEATSEDILETRTVPSDVIGRQLLSALPALSPDSGLNDAIVYTTPGVVADSNGFFHPLGDHAQVSYVIDGQPISDQRNKVFSTSIPANAIQSMEVISGSPAAEYGDKTSLIVNATTRSGLGQKPTGSFLASYGSFGRSAKKPRWPSAEPRWGNFLAANSQRTRPLSRYARVRADPRRG